MAPNELEKRLNQNNALTAPDDLKDEKMEGLEHLGSDDVQMPRILIAQQMSPQLNPDKPNYMEDLKVGDLFNSLTGVIYGRGPVLFTVIRADAPRWVEFIPREQGGGIKDPNVPFGDPRTEWRADKPPIATKFYDFIVVFIPSMEFAALSFKSTGLKVARQLNGLMQARMKPIYRGTYTLESKSTTNPKGTFFIPVVKNAGWVPPELRDVTKAAYENLKNEVIDIHRPEAKGETADEGDDATSFDTAAMEAQNQTSDM